MSATSAQRWLAVGHRSGGYELECWPGERSDYKRSLGNPILGEFDSQREAANAVARYIKRRSSGIVKLRLHYT
jgi:hypothetical protein